MAQQVIQLDREKLTCPICLDLLKDPVTIPCGHNYCMRCIEECWEEEKEKKRHSCPQCRQAFKQRPALVKNTLLAGFVEELEEVSPSPDQSNAESGEVFCDYCTEVNTNAVKSCLVCMASYCELHLQPHYKVPLLKKHKLTEATVELQDNICSVHQEVMKIFCRTDQQCICYLCSMEDHKGHDMTTATVERDEKRKELSLSQKNIQERIQDRERHVKMVQQKVDAINLSADEAVTDSEKTIAELIQLMQTRSSEVKQQIRSQQKKEVSQAEELKVKLQQELSELRKKNNELDKLSRTEDPLHFLSNYHSLSHLSKSEDFNIDIDPQSSFEGVAAAVSEAGDKVQAVLTEEWEKISLTVAQGDVFKPQDPQTRAEFLKYSRKMTLDPNTVNSALSLGDNNRKATVGSVDQVYPAHPDRFVRWWQVMCREGLTGRCYWEVNWSGCVYIAVTYKDVSRTGDHIQSGFGNNDKSWVLECDCDGCTFRHNYKSTFIKGAPSSTIGVYLDHKAGTLSFYSVSENFTLVHRVQTTFTQPLYAGFWPQRRGSALELCELK